MGGVKTSGIKVLVADGRPIIRNVILVAVVVDNVEIVSDVLCVMGGKLVFVVFGVLVVEILWGCEAHGGEEVRGRTFGATAQELL